jgi:hypothetical protein
MAIHGHILEIHTQAAAVAAVMRLQLIRRAVQVVAVTAMVAHLALQQVLQVPVEVEVVEQLLPQLTGMDS